jgi:hypothetical protein
MRPDIRGRPPRSEAGASCKGAASQNTTSRQEQRAADSTPTADAASPKIRLAFLLADADALERIAGLRELRALSLLLCGAAHPATIALSKAISDPTPADRALAEVDILPALRRRRLLAAYCAIMRRGGR